jgi:hypothetical protein
MLTGKMELAHARNQMGGYHYFLSAAARQLQRHVRWTVELSTRRAAACRYLEDPASLSARMPIPRLAGRKLRINNGRIRLRVRPRIGDGALGR